MSGWITDRDPDKDGRYIAAVGFKTIRTTPLDYTVEGGWNTDKDSDGVLDTTYVINNDDGYVKAWFEVPPYEGETC